MPLRIEKGKRKVRKYTISLNEYRNWNFFLSNDLKKIYKEMVKDKLEKIGMQKINRKIKIRVKYFHGTRRKSDLEGFCTVHVKFFQDALVELGYIEDDNYNHIVGVYSEYGGYDKNNGRVEIAII